MDFVSLILEASIVVQLVMLLLLLMSVYVWVLLLSKVVHIARVVKKSIAFHKTFSQSDDLFSLYQTISNKNLKNLCPLERIFIAGFAEYLDQVKVKTVDLGVSQLSVDLVRRAMQQKFIIEMESLEDRAPTLATIGSSAPYIGLFGTVFGIMNSFQALGAVKHATLSLVAPGISEALIATAMGLFVAIPAVIGYNRFSTHSDRIATQYEGFIDEFIRLIEKHLIINAHHSDNQSS